MQDGHPTAPNVGLAVKTEGTDGSLFISEKREDGVLIRPAVAVPADLVEVRRKIKTGLDQLKRGEGIPGEEVEAELQRMSAELRAKRP